MIKISNSNSLSPPHHNVSSTKVICMIMSAKKSEHICACHIFTYRVFIQNIVLLSDGKPRLLFSFLANLFAWLMFRWEIIYIHVWIVHTHGVGTKRKGKRRSMRLVLTYRNRQRFGFQLNRFGSFQAWTELVPKPVKANVQTGLVKLINP